MIVLDADILTLLFHKVSAVRVRQQQVPGDVLVRPTVVSRAELLRGRLDALVKADTAGRVLAAQAELAATEEFLAGFPPAAPFDAASAALFFQLIATPKLRRAGRKDMMNAAIALTLGATLVSRNVRDYRDVPGLKFDTW